ncbi:MAG: thiamine-phosphate kinase [Paludibacter sp.]|jgi:thiamine-monophosphate kinase|nr:thiamine-phosphate kinase [Paludibacter sp.]
MEISKLGEFGLISHLTSRFTSVNSSTLKSVGDDAAVLDYAGKKTLVTTDLLLEGIHFDLVYTPLRHLGYKAAIVNFSDIYAMNGQPRQITVSLGVSKRFTVEMLDELYEGINLACRNYNVDLVGGDTSASLTGLTISITCIGEGEDGKIVYRDGAKENDLVCVSGDLGAAYMGLQLLEREKIVFAGDPDAQPDFTGKDYILQRQLKPEARRDIIEQLAAKNIIPTAMMDISDGLSSELFHICTQSKAGCQIYEDKLPVSLQTEAMAEDLNFNVVTAVLNGGEDYELLFTANLDDYNKILTLDNISIIGHITKPEYGLNLVGRQGEEVPLKAQGWNAFETNVECKM